MAPLPVHANVFLSRSLVSGDFGKFNILKE